MSELNLIDGFVASARLFERRPALRVGKGCFSYGELAELVSKIAATIEREDEGASSTVATLAPRSPAAYAGLLATLVTGRAYVPLHTDFPLDRTATMLRLSRARVIVAGAEALDTLRNLLLRVDTAHVVIFPDLAELPDWTRELNGHRFCAARDLARGGLPLKANPPAEHAYILFTSGSTGEPKGVPVSHLNACSYIDYVSQLYEVSERDRVSQSYDLTFDLSVHDIFIALSNGACLHCVPANAVMAPARFIRDEELTLWFSVPSTVGRLRDLRMLKPGVFPSLRISLFCGEPLPREYVEQWRNAAPNSAVENLYGPTEATIAITRYRWHEASAQECLNGVVPIGTAFPGQRTRVVDVRGDGAAADGEGELCLAGSQVTRGYLNAPEKTRSQFVKLPGDSETTWYRTGDLVREAADGTLHYRSRIDDQVKIRGFRVELQEIEYALRKASDSAMAVAVPWPVRKGTAEGVVAFIQRAEAMDVPELIERCRKVLPAYMVPSKVRFVSEIPLNANGKIDRAQLARQLEES
jgi:amino acid adenylation domain-containing protein